MSQDLQKAKQLLSRTESTCVLCRGDLVYQTTLRGVRPLLDWLDSGEDTCGFSAADKVVGKAAALVYCLLGVRRVHGNVMSSTAVRVLRQNGIEVYWDTLVESVRNRTNTGLCPMEVATRDIDDPEQALIVIRKTLVALQQKT